MHYQVRGYNRERLFIPDMGSIESFIVRDYPMESKEEQAVWYLNSMRRHDGLEEYQSFDEIPVTITFTPMEE